jgi:hypothetical protein
MAKRVRGSVRPGQRRRVDRRPASSSSSAPSSSASASSGSSVERAPRPSGLSEAEIARAAEIEAQMLADERAAEEARSKSRQRAATREVIRSGPTGSLASAETEYAYVARDVRDIVRIAALELAILFGLWILIDVTHVIPFGS